MISPQSDITRIKQVRLFNIYINNQEKEELSNILKPIKPILNSNEKNSIYVFKDGESIHAEALIQIDGKISKAQSVGVSIKETLRKLVPKTIENTSTLKGGYENNYKLVG
ncbi:MAG: hypothetical protein ACPGJV_12075 [Bacteriovoracaceae bacterium]